ncbi:autophagy-related protein 27 [Helicostylum pulchrum]|uniref:Autophagy-related protein 27 n=1 Tax=Helicostylum pulchrum TaxID=562976 RepID=A0ABP9YD70_9FUNG|nr:autophagy-related protein 27 [Helicostylum pulchrum]
MKTSLGLALVFYSAGALALQSYCQPGFKPIESTDLKLDLGPLNKEFVLFRNTTTPPTVTSLATQINLCDPLPIPDEPENQDLCEKGALICRRTYVTKKIKDKENVWVTNVQNIAVDSGDRLRPEFKPIDKEADATKTGYQYLLTLNGGTYNDQAQSASITLECDESQSRSEKASDPVIIDYNDNNHVLTLRWKTVFACALKPDEKVPDHKDEGDDKKEESKGMSGIGIFFTIILVLGAVYFIGGAFYNYKVYNARGRDLIPHLEFWLDLPYLIRDLFAHVVDSVMSRRPGSGGYVAV